MASKYQNAYLLWQRLIKEANDGNKIQYVPLAAECGYSFAPPIYSALHEIMNYCDECNLPPLTMIVVNKKKQQGVGFKNKFKSQYSFDDVFNFDWGSIQNPFSFALDYKDLKEVESMLLSNPSHVVNEKLIHMRRSYKQRIFRSVLLRAYKNQCAVCGTNITEVLEGCHIKSYAECSVQEEFDPRNGILLCANHHKLFDQGLLKFGLDGIIHFSEKAINGNSSLSQINNQINKTQMLLPSDKKLYPNLSLQ